MEKNIQEIPIEDIIPNRFQPRLTFNEEGINELSESIKQHGIIQPLVVRKLGDKFEIIAGERRYKAATQAGLTKVPVVISDIDDNKSAEVALVENIQRRNLTAIEEAKSYKNLLDRGYLTQEQLATKMGVSQSTIANKLRLLNLDPIVQDALLNEKISERHARALLSLDDKEEQKKWLQRIIDERMTVRQLDMELKKAKNDDSEEDEGIPLVNINPDINNILNNAEDINVERKPHDIESMLSSPIKPVEEMKPTLEPEVNEPQKVPNKFFNFLEEEQANMSMDDTDEVFDAFVPNLNPTEDTNKNNDNNNIDMLDELDSNIDVFNNQDINKENSLANEETPKLEENKEEVKNIAIDNMSPSNEEINPFSFFGNPDIVNTELPKEENNSSIEVVEPVSSNAIHTNEIEEIIPEVSINTDPLAKNEDLIDPMDSVIKLDPNYEEIAKEESGTDLKSAINEIREKIDSMNRSGFTIELEEIDLDDNYQITIKIPKN